MTIRTTSGTPARLDRPGVKGSTTAKPPWDPPPTAADPLSNCRRTLTQDRLRSVSDRREVSAVRWAAHEAWALSWTTGLPHLFFPSLFEEISATALHRTRRQQDIYQRSRALLGINP